jgi:hypothetical protein
MAKRNITKGQTTQWPKEKITKGQTTQPLCCLSFCYISFDHCVVCPFVIFLVAIVLFVLLLFFLLAIVLFGLIPSQIPDRFSKLLCSTAVP